MQGLTGCYAGPSSTNKHTFYSHYIVTWMVYVCCFSFNWHTKDTIIDKPPELKQSKTIKKFLWVLQTAVKCFDKPLNALICHSDWALWIVFAHPVLIKWHAPNTIPYKTQGCFPSESLFSQKNLRLSVPRGSAFIGDYFYCQINITDRTSMPEIREIRYNKLRTCRQYFLEGSTATEQLFTSLF